MRRKVGTTLDADLYRLAKESARGQGRSVNALIEDALRRFLERQAGQTSAVEETRGIFKVSAKVLRAVLEEDLYGVD